MKYIQKGQEPDKFTEWKAQENEDWKPTYSNLQKPERSEVHESLLQEQGYICCYCGMRIDRHISHIEHFKPQKDFPDLALDYSNFLASCPGEGQDKSAENTEPQIKGVHCGHQKGEWYDTKLTVSPLDSNCADYFRYTGLGEILPIADPLLNAAAQETIKRLRLDHSRLEASRRSALQGIVDALNTSSNDDLQKLAEDYKKPNAKGEYVRFCGAVSYLLRHYST
jgi:uncharacterized protein (TIGR02646 family)